MSDNIKVGTRGAILLCFENDEYEVEFIDSEGETLEALTVAGSA
ncbi:MAG: DUF4926 domain-containing protein [Bdellovibrionales bacterium]|nr:DUF4926 domain-containing protein [Bdellovibrionales bacterium]